MTDSLDIEIHQRTRVYDGFFKLDKLEISYATFSNQRTPQHKREVLLREPTVSALLFDREKEVFLLTEQFRIGAFINQDAPLLLELPGGIIEQGESIETAIQREIVEETGYDIASLSTIGHFYLSPGGTSEKASLVAAQTSLESVGVYGAEGENESIRTHLFSFEQIDELLLSGRVSAITASGLLWLQQQRSS